MTREVTCTVVRPGSTELRCEMPDAQLLGAGGVTFLFGIFCAYWAITSGRSAWGWFFFGWLLAPIAGLVLLSKAADDRRPPRTP